MKMTMKHLLETRFRQKSKRCVATTEKLLILAARAAGVVLWRLSMNFARKYGLGPQPRSRLLVGWSHPNNH